MINIARDSDGVTWQLWKQDQKSSCGVASTWMARGIVKQMSFNEGEWDLAQRVYRRAVNNALAPLGVSAIGPMSINPAAFPSNQGTMASTIANTGFTCGQLAAAIRGEGINVSYYTNGGAAMSLRSQFLSERQAAIVFVSWQGGGAHFVVAARQNSSGKIVFLDPWDGQVNELNNNGNYVANYGDVGTITQALYLS